MSSSTAQYFQVFAETDKYPAKEISYFPKHLLSMSHLSISPQMVAARWDEIEDNMKFSEDGLYFTYINRNSFNSFRNPLATPSQVYQITVMKTHQAFFVSAPEWVAGSGNYGTALSAVNKRGEWSIIKCQKGSLLDEFKMTSAAGLLDHQESEQLSPVKIDQANHMFRSGEAMVLQDGKGKNLYLFMKSAARSQYPAHRWLDVVAQIVNRVNVLFTLGIFHQDLKWENIIYNDLLNLIRIIDFGIATKSSPRSSVKEKIIIGTPFYLPPEFIQAYRENKEYEHNEKTLIYCLGVMIKEILGISNSAEFQEFFDLTANIIDIISDNETVTKDDLMRFDKLSHDLGNADDKSEKFPLGFGEYKPTQFSDKDKWPELHKFVNTMTSFNPENRPGLDAVNDFFSKLRNHFSSELNVAVINIQELLHLQKIYPDFLEEKDNADLITDLQKFSEIQFVLPKEPTSDEMEQINRMVASLREYVLIRKNIYIAANIHSFCLNPPSAFARQDKAENIKRNYSPHFLTTYSIAKDLGFFSSAHSSNQDSLSLLSNEFALGK